MRAKINFLVEHLKASYWFIPAVMAVTSFILSLLFIRLDIAIGPGWVIGLPVIGANEPDGARAILTAISGSMIGVAGTVLSVTMAAVVYASGQYGPRLLTNYLSDRGNQVTLGTFTATFVFSITVMRAIRSADDGHDVTVFVPNISVLACMVLALCSIAVLIFFVHHVPTRVHISHVIAEIGDTLLNAIDKRFPIYIGEPEGEAALKKSRALEEQVPHPFDDEIDSGGGPSFKEVRSRSTGYIQVLDDHTLMSTAVANDLVLRLHVQPGTFVFDGTVMYDVWPDENFNNEIAESLRSAMVTGPDRTPANDMLFLIDELVEIACRALSPGVNDAFTAITCINWMGAALAQLSGRQMPGVLRADDDGKLRVITMPMAFGDYLRKSFGAMRDDVASNKIASLQYLGMLTRVARHCKNDDHLELIRKQGESLIELVEDNYKGESLAEIKREAATFRRSMADPGRRETLDEEGEDSGKAMPEAS